jgi:hypothetical protein
MEKHKHKYKKAFKQDRPEPNSNYTGRPRWILFNICDCGKKTAYDITYSNPKHDII